MPKDDEDRALDQSERLRPAPTRDSSVKLGQPRSYYNPASKHRHIAAPLNQSDRCLSDDNIRAGRLARPLSGPLIDKSIGAKSLETLGESLESKGNPNTTFVTRRRSRPVSQEISPRSVSVSTEELIDDPIRYRKGSGSRIAELQMSLGMVPESGANHSRPISPLTTSRSSMLNSITESDPVLDQSASSSGARQPPSRQESVSSTYARSESSSVGPHPDFPLPPSELLLENVPPAVPVNNVPVGAVPEIPEDIQKTMSQIKRASDSMPELDAIGPSSNPMSPRLLPTPPIEPVPISGSPSPNGTPPPPEPDTELLPNSYFQPQLIAKLRLVDSDNAENENSSSSSNEEQISDVILKHERNILHLTQIKEELIVVYRNNEELGEEIGNIIKNKCPKTVVSSYLIFNEDIESQFSLMSKLSGRLLRVESSLKEEHDPATREALEQKYKALKGCVNK